MPKRSFAKLKQHYLLPLVVFLTGAAVLIIEVVATRILSPYFGNTLYSVSSILGVVLGALSIGYYVGGRLADKRPEPALFYSIILLGGVSVLVLHLLSQLFLPVIGYELSIMSGPLICSMLLFFLPGFLLGMLSPFAIKLQEKRLPKTGIGTIAGEMFFWSTLGSIAGSLSAGFLLVPLLGISITVISVGVFLVLLGAVPLLKMAAQKSFVNKVIPVAIGLTLFSISLLSLRQQNIVYATDGLYEKIAIIDGEYNGQPVRYFQQDRSSSSAMYLNSDELVYDYTNYYQLYKAVKPDAQRSLVIGGAAYSIPKALLNESPTMQVDVAEIEPSLEELGKNYFNVPETPRLATHITDGRRLLATAEKPYDLIFSDVYYSLYSIPAHFTTQDFFATAKQKLSQNGVFIANLIGSLKDDNPSFIYSELKTFASVFPNCYLFAVNSPQNNGVQNLILVGVNGDKPLDVTAPVLAQNKDKVMRELTAHTVDVDTLHLAPHMMLTDDHAPVEFMMARLLSNPGF